MILLVLYTDGLALFGTFRLALPLFLRLHELMGFSQDCITQPRLRSVIGLELVRAPRIGGQRRAFITQDSYMKTTIQKFLDENKLDATILKPVSTLAKTKPDAKDAELRKHEGVDAKDGSKHIGGLLWVSRGTRLDISKYVRAAVPTPGFVVT